MDIDHLLGLGQGLEFAPGPNANRPHTDLQAPADLPAADMSARLPWTQRYDIRFLEGHFPDPLDGIEQPDSGSVLLDGRDLLPIPPEKRAVNLMFQSYALFPNLSIADNVPVAFLVVADNVPECAVQLAHDGATVDQVGKLIDELEGTRNIYCGALGIVDADSREADLSVAIRTFWKYEGRLWFGAGAGITWGSDPEQEWEETELKSRNLIAIASRDSETAK